MHTPDWKIGDSVVLNTRTTAIVYTIKDLNLRTQTAELTFKDGHAFLPAGSAKIDFLRPPRR